MDNFWRIIDKGPTSPMDGNHCPVRGTSHWQFMIEMKSSSLAALLRARPECKS